MLSESNKSGLILLAASLFAVYCFVFGQSGVLERMRYQKEKSVLQNELEILKDQNVRLNTLYKEYTTGAFAEYESENAGYTRGKSLTVHFKNLPVLALKQKQIVSDEPFISIDNLRIVWISFSIISLLLYFIIVQRKRRVLINEENHMDL